MAPPSSLLTGCDLPAAWSGRAQWRVLTLGCPAGLAFLATWAAWCADPQRPRLLHVVACDPCLLDAGEILRAAHPYPELQPFAQKLAEQCWGLLPGVHRLAFEGGHVLLTLLVGEPQALLRQQQPLADSVYLNGAALAHGPGALHTLKAVARCCRRGTRLAARSMPPEVQGLLATTGFALHAKHGPAAPGGDLLATFDPPWQPRPGRPPLAHAALADRAEPGHCLVIGAGLAGSAVAASLASRGWRVTVLDAAAGPAAGASGLPAGVFASHVSPDDSLLSRLSRAGVRTTLQTLAHLLPDTQGTDWQETGVLEHDAEAPPRLAWSDGPGLDWSRPATAQQLAQSHLPPATPACWHARGGWVRPAQLIGALLATPGITWRGQARVARLVRRGSQWLALDEADAPLAEAAPLAVVCAGPASALVSGTPLPLQLLRGQIAWGVQAQAPGGAPWPPQPVNGHGNLVPQVPLAAAQGAPGWVLGSTFERGCGELPVSAADALAGRAENLAKLQVLQPALAEALAPAFAQPPGPAAAVRTWAAVRCAAPDRLPIVGPLDAQALPGLWASTAMGARGLTLALLCGELLAARLQGEPLPLEARLAQALGTERLPTQH
ncbi:FAD-dependent cmnm(5)s(2)U34 oxidoreductase [Pulveribacter suum]|uniref:FAD-dependent cmnm(5)s(2)U34 oxidoreductase n=1 Tax=Pulveribacter suum TaxID=2116657 RepID=A0A2P1NMJ6_9BURK|nr:FAD-dependent cmnm(5)s(2)U34 oxidoreductase [Pulveribacter suum]